MVSKVNFPSECERAVSLVDTSRLRHSIVTTPTLVTLTSTSLTNSLANGVLSSGDSLSIYEREL